MPVPQLSTENINMRFTYLSLSGSLSFFRGIILLVRGFLLNCDFPAMHIFMTKPSNFQMALMVFESGTGKKYFLLLFCITTIIHKIPPPNPGL